MQPTTKVCSVETEMGEAKKFLSISTFVSITLATASATTLVYCHFFYQEFDEDNNNQS